MEIIHCIVFRRLRLITYLALWWNPIWRYLNCSHSDAQRSLCFKSSRISVKINTEMTRLDLPGSLRKLIHRGTARWTAVLLMQRKSDGEGRCMFFRPLTRKLYIWRTHRVSCKWANSQNVFMKIVYIYIATTEGKKAGDAGGVVALFLLNASKLRTKKMLLLCVCM